MKAPLAVIAGLALIGVAHSLAVAAQLPPYMASHFGAAGEPNGFAPRAAFFTAFALIGGFTLSALLATSALLSAMPTHLWNLPNRDYWLAPERRAATVARMQAFISWLAVGLAAFLLGVLELVLAANLDRKPLWNPGLYALLGALLAGTLFAIVRLYRSFRLPEC